MVGPLTFSVRVSPVEEEVNEQEWGIQTSVYRAGIMAELAEERLLPGRTMGPKTALHSLGWICPVLPPRKGAREGGGAQLPGWGH